MAKLHSAGVLLYRRHGGLLQVLLIHPGGPYWARKDEGAWSIPKGEYADTEDALAAARREFTEETGFAAEGSFLPLGAVNQRSGKMVHAWALEGDVDPARLRSNMFRMEWPPKSGLQQEFPEVDRAAWFDPATARRKLIPGQVPLVDTLVALLDAGSPDRVS
jgi:predicted NUDIX family NTP pyrophosphohydrolase